MCERTFDLMPEIIITPFWMQIPNRAMKPIPAEIEKLKWVINKAIIPPAAANGTFSSTRPASLAFEKRMKRMTKIMAMEKTRKMQKIQQNQMTWKNQMKLNLWKNRLKK